MAAIVVLMIGLLLCGCGLPQKEADEGETAIARAEGETDAYQEVGQILGIPDAKEDEVKARLGELVQLAAASKPLRDPTYAEAVDFMKADNTNIQIPFDHPLAAIVVVENAAKQGIKGYWVVAEVPPGSWGPSGYNFVGFNTTDRGWTYFCNSGSCGDEEVKLEERKNLYQLNPQWGSAPSPDSILKIHRDPPVP